MYYSQGLVDSWLYWMPKIFSCPQLWGYICCVGWVMSCVWCHVWGASPSSLVTMLPCIDIFVKVYMVRKYGAHFMAVWAQSGFERLVNKSSSGAELWRAHDSCSENECVSVCVVGGQRKEGWGRKIEREKKEWHNCCLAAYSQTAFMQLNVPLL